RGICRPEPHNAGAVAERRRERLAHDDTRVLHQVVRVDMQVTGAFELHVDAGVARDLLEHVVQEGQARRDVDATAAVKGHARAQLRLLALALDLSDARLTQGEPPPRARDRSGLPSPRAGPWRRAASPDRHGSSSARWSAS